MLNCAVVGFGNVASGYGQDPKMADYFSHITHADVLRDHPDFTVSHIIDPDHVCRKRGADLFPSAHCVANLEECDPAALATVDVVILATPPHIRLTALEYFPNCRAVLCEKPIAASLDEAVKFNHWAQGRDVPVQVNYWRRAERRFIDLAQEGLKESVGRFQCGQAVYGNGLHNNGGHMIDFARMLLGEITAVQALGPSIQAPNLPLKEDVALSFALYFGDVSVTFQHIDFSHYREIALTLWGDQGRFDCLQESQVYTNFARVSHRGVSGEDEIASDRPQGWAGLSGRAYYDMYDNLAQHLKNGKDLYSPIDSAVENEKIIRLIEQSARNDGLWVAR